MPLDIEHLRGWIGRTETLSDTVTPAPLHALAATLDHDARRSPAAMPCRPAATGLLPAAAPAVRHRPRWSRQARRLPAAGAAAAAHVGPAAASLSCRQFPDAYFREGMSVFIVDLHQAIGHGLSVAPIPNLVNHETNELFFDNLEIPAENLIGVEGQGFRYILDGLNAERTLIAAECIGDGYWFIERARRYAGECIVFDRPIGMNQGVQFPIADAFIEIEAANLMHIEAARRFDAHESCGAQANMAKYLAAKASCEAANVCLQTHGGFGFANEYDIERKFGETRLYQVAPISTNLIYAYVAEHVLGLPSSF